MVVGDGMDNVHFSFLSVIISHMVRVSHSAGWKQMCHDYDTGDRLPDKVVGVTVVAVSLAGDVQDR